MPRPDRDLVVMTAYGFVSGLPLPLSGFTFRLWLSDAGFAPTAIGLTAWIGLAYSLKFLWAPLLDRSPPLSALRRFGRRRGWLLLIQPLLGIAALLLAVSNPASLPVPAFAAVTCVAFLSATQDIAIDAWRIETFPERRQGLALAVYVWGYRIAMLVSMTGVIGVASAFGWHLPLIGVAGLVAAGTLVTLSARSEGPLTQPVGRGFRHAVIEPVRSFLIRPSALLVLAFVALFKLGEAMAGLMTAPFYRHLGFDKAVIAGIGPFSLGGTLAGITLGGWLVSRIGVGRALLATGWAQTIAMGMYVVLSMSPNQPAVLFATVTVEAFAQGMADAAFLTFLSALCARAFAATQYALLSSVPQLAIHTIGAVSGLLAESLGWTTFYIVCMASAFPGMVLMLILLRRGPDVAKAPVAAA
jgi:PAT family beta-lactamase induction signal transducer AmpG